LLLEWVEFQKIVPRLVPVVGKVISRFKHWIFKFDALAFFRWNFLNFIDDLYVLFIRKIRAFNPLSSYDSISDFEEYINHYIYLLFLGGTKSVDVVLIRHNDNTGSSSISTKGESRPNSSINDKSGESLVDTTLSILKMLLLGYIKF